MTYATVGISSSTEDVTFESISKAIEDFKRKFPPRRQPPQRFVTTDECYEALKSNCEQKAKMFGEPFDSFGSLLLIYGIPIEHYPTEAECVCRAAELFSQHKLRVALVTTGDKIEPVQ